MEKEVLYSEIKEAVKSVMPGSKVLIYGSYARNEQHGDSDIDIMVIVNATLLPWAMRKEIRYAIYALEIKHQIILSPKVLTETEWNDRKHSSPFYESILEEGIVI
ncbi:MAG: nucleotidyltransferase domain-containing protein [Bacteroidia bacterium]